MNATHLADANRPEPTAPSQTPAGPEERAKPPAPRKKQETSRPDLTAITGILTAEEIMEHFIRGTKETAKRKFFPWLSGRRRSGYDLVPINAPLKHFRDGETILVLVEWLREFVEANRKQLASDISGPPED